MQILRSTPATIQLNVYQNGTLTDLDASPSIAITDANGTAVTPGSVTKPGTTTGIYQSTLPPQADLKTLNVVWSGALASEAVSFTQKHEVVGNHLFTEAEARGARFSGAQAPLSSETTYPDSVVAAMREQITTQFEEKTSHSWIRRYCRMELTGSGTRVLSLYDGHPRDVDGNEVGGAGRLYNVVKIISASIGGVALAVGDLELFGRRIIHTTGTWTRGTITSPHNVVVEYEYGDDPVDLEARENGLRAVVANLVPSDLPDYAQTISHTGESLSLQQDQGLRVWPAKTKEWLDRNPRRRIPVAI